MVLSPMMVLVLPNATSATDLVIYLVTARNPQNGITGLIKRGNVCFECGAQGHFKRDCLKLKNNNNRGNRVRNAKAQAKVYAMGNAGANPNNNVVTGSFDVLNGMDWWQSTMPFLSVRKKERSYSFETNFNRSRRRQVNGETTWKSASCSSARSTFRLATIQLMKELAGATTGNLGQSFIRDLVPHPEELWFLFVKEKDGVFSVERMSIYSKIDLWSGYHPVEMSKKEDIPKDCIQGTRCMVTMEFQVMSFGLTRMHGRVGLTCYENLRETMIMHVSHKSKYSIHPVLDKDVPDNDISDDPLVVPLEGLQVDDKLHFVEEPVEIIDREVKQLRRSRVPIVKVRWNSRRGPEFTWEREDQFRKKYPHLFTKTAPSSSVVS
ncbi:putative reverse transcriptase domain-containing protein [Tanacetum coccineum]